MAKFRCVCGETLRTSGNIPNPIEWHVLSSMRLDALGDTIEIEQFFEATTFAYKCPVSGHFWIFWDGLGSAPSGYAPLEQ